MKLSVFILLFLFSTSVYSHGGRTNSEGCHNDNAGGTGYHCHDTEPSSPSTPTVPVPEPKPDTTPGSYPVASQNTQILRGEFNETPSNYTDKTANLQCVNTINGAYDLEVALSGDKFCITALEESAEECTEYSGKFSFITRILTVFDIKVGAANYQAGLELDNTSKCFNLFYSRHKAENHQASVDYDRDLWGRWIDEDRDCRDTRDEVLKIFNQNSGTNESCDISAGLWLDPYTATEFTDSSDLDIDHIVPVGFAHGHGAANWSSTLKQQFYNDIENLLPVSASANRSKGDRSPIDWMPDNTEYHCTYVDSFLYIVDKYHLDLSDVQREGIQNRCLN
ncbi:HNH endonuclease family protein [Nitrosomonas marina]|uniref:GmrSD restriction endonucleases C-terminal domain-containing protein n=1 Tax=Nitrosomonas marina TaxID=917 RepID=A0A1H8IHK3_9PROT|nr:HNH endonuclease family protein [Nitrosomonas marina]SEN67198.1 Protein of unknown function [Nitrosomonas marina]